MSDSEPELRARPISRAFMTGASGCRTYAKLGGELSYSAWLDSLKAGHSYVSDGKTHLMDFRVNGVEVGASDDIHLDTSGKVRVTLKAAAYLPVNPNEEI